MITKNQMQTNVYRVENKWKVSSETLVDPKEVLWKDLHSLEKTVRVVSGIAKIFGIFLMIFGFICTLALVADSFKLIGGRGVGTAIKSSAFIKNPISASIIGMIITLIIQSSSTLISVLVGMIAGGLITVHQAIPIMLGAEMGASLINALVSLTQVGNRDHFRRAFAAVTVNDVFNFLSYFIILPIEIGAGLIEKISAAMVQPLSGVKTSDIKTLNFFTDPVLNYIIQINNDALGKSELSSENSTLSDNDTFIYRCPYYHIFIYSRWSDTIIGIVLLVIAIGALIGCLIGIVKLMTSLLGGQIGILVRKLMDKNLPRPFTCLTNYMVMVVGCVIVMIIQSSSVFRSVLTPLVGIGVVTLERLYPLILGANVGTTFTGVLAAFSADPAKIRETLQIALAQTVYNLIGVLLFYPIPCMKKIPINIAKKLGNTTAKYRWFALIYIAVIFFIMPAYLLGISFLPLPIMLSFICIPLGVLMLLVFINFFQSNCPRILPQKLRSWDFLPDYLHSLHPYDKIMIKYCTKIPYVGKCFERNGDTDHLGLNQENNLKIMDKLLKLQFQTQV